ncbi:hypothetical protein GGR39_003360 [Novosphingobium fluoreni]|uniref:Uncharacterized protein n=1 Tax=Novosphingobium fluoreni TaxID=1391222 RepID=A0A7W6C4R9_9SPHN|nr:hypothetical protein [Novosphingobium fluoreni]
MPTERCCVFQSHANACPPCMGNRVSAGWGGLHHLVSMLRMSGAISCTSGYFPDGPGISHRRSRTRVFRGSTLATRRPKDLSQREGPFPQPAGAIRFRRLFATGIAHYPLRTAARSQTTHLAFGHLFPNCHKLRRDSSTRLADAMGRAGRCLACRPRALAFLLWRYRLRQGRPLYRTIFSPQRLQDAI